jgi:hypothetical protein
MSIVAKDTETFFFKKMCNISNTVTLMLSIHAGKPLEYILEVVTLQTELTNLV